MNKKTVIWVCALVFVTALSVPALADQSIGYQQYFNKGVNAFKEHDDQKALRCFKIAQIYDPSDEEVKKYIDILEKKGEALELPPSTLPPDESIGYKYYLAKGIEAYQKHETSLAVRYFNLTVIFNPDSREADNYLQLLSQKVTFTEEHQSRPLTAVEQPVVEQAVVEQAVIAQPVVEKPAAVQAVAQQPVVEQPQVIAQVRPPAATPQAVIYVAHPRTNKSPVEITLNQIGNNGQLNPKMQVEINSSVILEGKNIKRFLIVDEGFINVKALDNDRLEIDASRIGATFLHIWDDLGRHTVYVEVVFPKSVVRGWTQENNGVEHSQPFRFNYSNDWNTNYSGKNLSNLKRQSYEFSENLTVTGETPYGFLDSSVTYSDFNSISQFDTYTIGLSQIPLDGTRNFNIRGFDSPRYLSPLTLPTTSLRGVFADVDLMDGLVGLSVSHGQVLQTTGFIFTGASQNNDSYVDAAKLTLFPESNTDRYSFNFATAYGRDRPRYLSDHVYSIEGLHQFNDHLSLNAEEGSDSAHDATLASLKWKNQDFSTSLNFRNIDKSYAAISSLPAYQGETGATWVTNYDSKAFTASSYVEAYKDRLNANPDNSGALDYDAYGQITVNIADNLTSDSDLNFLDTQGDLSPQRSFSFHERLSRSFGIWNSLKGTVFGGAGYQNNNSSNSNISNFNREDVLAGIQLPLTSQVFSFVNYEYDWLNQPISAGGRANPSVINAGLDYEKALNPRLTFNSQLNYRDELGVNTGDSLFSGEKSVIITLGMAYNPVPDVSIFADADATKVLSHTGNPSYDDIEFHLGVRIAFGTGIFWDPLGTITGTVFKDFNGSGKFAPGDEGIAGVKLKVGEKEVVTDKNGRYRVKVRAKGVDVIPVLDSIPGGLIFSTPQSLHVRVTQGHTSHADFGLISQTGIYGIVFLDKNGNGVPDQNDKFIGKVRVTLDGQITQKSDFHGAFYFRKVTPGEHVISIDINSIALDYVPQVKLKNNIIVAEGTNYLFNIPLQVKKQVGDQQ